MDFNSFMTSPKYNATLWEPPLTCQRRLMPISKKNVYFPIEISKKEYFYRLIDIISLPIISLESIIAGYLPYKNDPKNMPALPFQAQQFLNLLSIAVTTTQISKVEKNFNNLIAMMSQDAKTLILQAIEKIMLCKDQLIVSTSNATLEWEETLLQSPQHISTLFDSCLSFIKTIKEFFLALNIEFSFNSFDLYMTEIKELSNQFKLHKLFQAKRLGQLGWKHEIEIDSEYSTKIELETSAITPPLDESIKNVEKYLYPKESSRIQLLTTLVILNRELVQLSNSISERSLYSEAARLRDLAAILDYSIDHDNRVFLEEVKHNFQILMATIKSSLLYIQIHRKSASYEQAEALEQLVIKGEAIQRKLHSFLNDSISILYHPSIASKIHNETTVFITSDYLFNLSNPNDLSTIGGLLIKCQSDDLFHSIESWPGLTSLQQFKDRYNPNLDDPSLIQGYGDTNSIDQRTIYLDFSPTKSDSESFFKTKSKISEKDKSNLSISSTSSSNIIRQTLQTYELITNQIDVLLTPISTAHTELLCRLIGMHDNLNSLIEINIHSGNQQESFRLKEFVQILDCTIDEDEKDQISLPSIEELDQAIEKCKGRKKIDSIINLIQDVTQSIGSLNELKAYLKIANDYVALKAINKMIETLHLKVDSLALSIKGFSILDPENDTHDMNTIIDINEKIAREGTEFLTSDFLFSYSSGPQGHSIGSLAIVSGSGAILRFIMRNWPAFTILLTSNLTLPSSGDIYDSSSLNIDTQTLQSSEKIDFKDPNSLRLLGFRPHHLKNAGFNDIEILTSGYTAEELREAGFSAKQISSISVLSQNILRVAGVNKENLFDLILDILEDLYVSTNGSSWRVQNAWKELITLKSLSKGSVGSLQPQTVIKVLNKLNGIALSSDSNGTFMSEIFKIQLTKNSLKGSIPLSLGSLVQLRQLNLSQNELSGSIPPTLGLLANLEILCLDNNHLTGIIPSSFKNLQNLMVLRLDHNELTGPLPASFGSLYKLKRMDLSYNKLSGSLPSRFGLSLSKLQELLLGFNQLSGQIPESWGGLIQLTHLDLQNNQLESTVPESFEKLTKLSGLYLQGNISIMVHKLKLQKSLPKCRIKL